MALVDNAWYVNFGDGATTGYWGLTKWAAGTVYAAGAIRRPSGQATVTISSANPGVVTWGGGSPFAHNMAIGDSIVFTTTGALPTNIVAGTTYYLVATVAANTFSVAATPGGTAINTTAGTQSGTHTGTAMHVGNERVFVCVAAGTSGGTEPVWTFTRGVKITDNTVTWQECTGIAALNGDATNTPSWTITATPPGGVKNTAVTLGQVIKRDNGASYQICTTAGTAGNGAEPAFSNTAGTTTADNTVTWTSLGVVGNFTGWQAPHARLANAFTATWGQAGNAFYVGDNDVETQATAMTLTSPGTGASPCNVYCVNHSGSLPPVSADLRTTATISTTGNSAQTFNGTAYYYGIIFSCGDGANAPTLTVGNNAGATMMELCALRSGGTSSSVIKLGGNSAAIVDLLNTTIQVAATGSAIQTGNGLVRWRGATSSITGATLPTTLFTAYNSTALLIDGVDLSALGSGKTLFGNQNSFGSIVVNECKLGASVTPAAANTNIGGPRIDFIRCDSGGTNYFDARRQFAGTQDQEATIIRTGGATDGTTPLAWKLVTTANSKWVAPFESQPITIWNDSTSPITTLTIYGTTTGGGVPKDDEIWAEVEYLGASGSPLGSFKTSTKADNLAASAATNNSADASTWGGGGAGNGFKIVVPSFTPGQKGPINITIKAAKATTTYYIDPKPSISGVTVSKSFAVAPGVYANELAGASVANVGLHPIDMGIAA